ncbi:LysE family translocator [Ralstonia solanacearum]|uniref:Lysine transporter LysE n=1 Tax=Ralstonia solanacearum K60 TaxID=1091042 RepID=A0AAP8D3Z0_RALSL|nr:LysE family translocator [Ralstonia solanacearum]MBT1536778.1 LysE family translocator [Ralstonia solanacearum]OYQ13234.1 lysine transporter LysE [Ralstonia solanacearum K60]QOK83590.1 LysE family translocator [Ralstonia solanacearum]RIJ86998.1 LysE family translocator [Ralstonia solanacearum]CCF98915.1 putative transporter transmembrane protein, amino acid efflux protein, LysE family [Ralstonia solanacearum K60]
MSNLGIVNLPLFMLAVFLLNVTPGPDTAYIVGRSVSQGRAAGLISSLGVSAGCCVHVLAVAFGLTALLAASTVAFTVIKVIGAAYLIYLGGRMLLAPPERDDALGSSDAPEARAMEAAAVRRPRPLRALFMQGFLTNVLNPKVVLFFLSFFPQFVDPGTGHKAVAFLALGAVFIAMSTAWNSLVAWVAASVTRRVAGKPGIKRWLDRVVGTAFIGLGARLAFSTR